MSRKKNFSKKDKKEKAERASKNYKKWSRKIGKDLSQGQKLKTYGQRRAPAPLIIKNADGSQRIVQSGKLEKRRPKKSTGISRRLETLAVESGYKTYEEYLRSPIWKELRRQALLRDKFTCQRCPSKEDLQVHHLRYPTVLGRETLEMLETLCQGCHKSHHGKPQKKKRRRKKRKSGPVKISYMDFEDLGETEENHLLEIAA